MATRIHVISAERGRWGVKEEGDESLLSTHETRPEAIEAARAHVNGSEQTVMVHAEDGSFLSAEEVKREMEKAHHSTPSSSRLQQDVYAHDIHSVGTRVRWSALFSGLLIALAINIPLATTGVALGLTAINAEWVSANGLQWMTVGWIGMSVIVSLFLGGFVASRNTTWESPMESLQYGALIWAMFMIGVPAVAALGVDLAPSQVITSQWQQAFALADDVTQQDIQKTTGVTSDAAGTIKKSASNLANDLGSVSPAVAAWTSLGVIALSLMVCCLGAYCGTGPNLDPKVIRATKE